MSDDHIAITFKCKNCGGTTLILPDNPTDDSIAKCQSCEIEVGRWGDIKREGVKLAKSHVPNIAKRIFKRR